MKKYIGYIPLIVITVMMINCIYTVNTSYLAFSSKHYIGLAGIILSIIAAFISPGIAKIITLLILILATFNFAAFTAIVEYHRIGYNVGGNGIDMKIQVTSLLLLILFMVLNLGLFKSLLRSRV